MAPRSKSRPSGKNKPSDKSSDDQSPSPPAAVRGRAETRRTAVDQIVASPYGLRTRSRTPGTRFQPRPTSNSPPGRCTRSRSRIPDAFDDDGSDYDSGSPRPSSSRTRDTRSSSRGRQSREVANLRIGMRQCIRPSSVARPLQPVPLEGTEAESQENPNVLEKKQQTVKRPSRATLKCEKYEEHLNTLVKRMKKEEFTAEYVEQSGLKEVIIFDEAPDGLRVPSVDQVSYNEIKKALGAKREVKYFSQKMRKEYSTSLHNLLEMFEQPVDVRQTPVNVLSLEVSGTTLGELVQPPALIRWVDWASAWPAEWKHRTVSFNKGQRKRERQEGQEEEGEEEEEEEREESEGSNDGQEVEDEEDFQKQFLFRIKPHFPCVEKYLILSMEGSYTSFHLDFFGSSVYYAMVKGSKTFFLCPPTPKNLEEFEKYLKDKNASFFGSQAEKCVRVTLTAGQTLILPSGWIHAVFTNEDSIVVGGNFLTTRSIEMQLRIARHEEEMNVKKDHRYPQADEVAFYFINQIVEKISGLRHIGPQSKNRKGLEYVGPDFIQRGHHKDVPVREAYAPGGSALSRTYKESADYNETTALMRKFKKEAFPNNDDFEVPSDPLIRFHPDSFDIEDELDNLEENPCRWPLGKAAPKIEINPDALVSEIHREDIYQLELLLESLLKKTRVNLPDGLTRPNSLLYSLHVILQCRRQENDAIGIPAEVELPQRWTEGSIEAEEEEMEDDADSDQATANATQPGSRRSVNFATSTRSSPLRPILKKKTTRGQADGASRAVAPPTSSTRSRHSTRNQPVHAEEEFDDMSIIDNMNPSGETRSSSTSSLSSPNAPTSSSTLDVSSRKKGKGGAIVVKPPPTKRQKVDNQGGTSSSQNSRSAQLNDDDQMSDDSSMEDDEEPTIKADEQAAYTKWVAAHKKQLKLAFKGMGGEPTVWSKNWWNKMTDDKEKSYWLLKTAVENGSVPALVFESTYGQQDSTNKAKCKSPTCRVTNCCN